MINTPAPPRRYRLIRVGHLLLGATAVVLAVAGFTDIHTIDTVAWPLRNGFSIAAGLLCVGRAALIRGERAPWAVLGLGMVVYGSATLYFDVHKHLGAGGETVVGPSLADLGWLAFYPACYAAVILLLRRRVLRLPNSLLLDGLVGLLGVAALTSALGTLITRSNPDYGLKNIVIALVYPLADLLLVLLVASVFSLLGRRPGRVWWLLGSGMIFFVAADTAMATKVSSGGFAPGGSADVLWALSMLMLALAAWQRQPWAPPARVSGLGVIVVPTVLALAAIGILVAGAVIRLPLVAVSLAAATVLAALGRAALTFVEVEQLAETKVLARTDDLTGLVNRRGFVERLTAATRDGPAGDPAALLMIDLNRFKMVNDSLGHKVGDQLLAAVSSRFLGALRPEDLLARFGGDEFAVLLEDTDGAGARLVADRILASVEESFDIGGMTLNVNASIGSALYPGDAADADGLLARADVAMYAAKNAGTGVEHYDAAADHSPLLQLNVIESLRSAIPTDQIELVFQPKLHIASDRVSSVEALARWRHPTRGLLTPDSFVPLAEHAGLMRALTQAVLRQSLAQAARWRDSGLDITVAVNISASDLLDQAFPDHVQGQLARYDLAPDRLELELTETTLMLDRARSVAVLSQLHEIGVGIAVDDYGTGYSALAYLGGEFPVDVIKLDRAFVRRLEHNAVAQTIVRSTADLAHALGLLIVIEGVENPAALDLLRGFGCDYAQGYLVSCALPAQDITERLRRSRQDGWSAAVIGAGSQEAHAVAASRDPAHPRPPARSQPAVGSQR
jgi:diguanylate cyclase (GGDEF)-like protein